MGFFDEYSLDSRVSNNNFNGSGVVKPGVTEQQFQAWQNPAAQSSLWDSFSNGVGNLFSDNGALSSDALLGKMTDDGFQQGSLMPALGGISNLMGAWAGWKQMGLAKDQFNLQKQAYQENLNQQKQSLENQHRKSFKMDSLLNNGPKQGTDEYDRAFQSYLKERSV